jgi:D-3-phosphoglycerate dehydrogenase
MKWKVFITREIPGAGIELLKNAGMQVEIYMHNRPVPESVLLEKIKDCDALLCLLTDAISAPLLAAAKRLKIIANYAVGYNNIDLPAATRHGIVVTNTPDVLTETTADLAFALILACARRIVEGDQLVRRGKFTGWSPMLMLGMDVFDRTIGIIGAGRIGTAVARRAQGFGMKILYSDSTSNRIIEKEYRAQKKELEDLLRNADFISLHIPLTDSTRHLIDEQRLRQMKATAFLINTSRGPVIDEQALVRALANKVIAGAGLDVYEREPFLAEGLADLSNVVLLPHLGSATFQTREKMAKLAAKNIIELALGHSAPNAVN